MSNSNRNNVKRKNCSKQTGGSRGKSNHNSSRVMREQPKADNGQKRINLDNERASKFAKNIASGKASMENIIKSLPAANDFEWYNHNPELLRSASQLPFASICGAPMHPVNVEANLPGVMSFAWNMNLGPLPEVAMNQAKDSIYSFLVHANSRNYNYDPADLMIMILAGTSIFTALQHVIRAYGCAKKYIEQSTYMPDALLSAMGFDPDDVRANLSNMWFTINEWITRTAQIWLPNTMPILKRWIWLNTNIYKDAEDPKAQLYLFVPNRLYEFSATGNPHGSAIIAVREQLPPGEDSNIEQNYFNPFGNVYKWDDWKRVIERMFKSLLSQQDRGDMYGDILNAYTADRIFAMTEIPVDYMVEPVYNPYVLSQIENLTTSQSYMIGIYQTSNLGGGWLSGIYAKDYTDTTSGWVVPPSHVVVNIHNSSQPSEEEIVEATRLTCAGGEFNERVINLAGDKEDIWFPTTGGSEVISGIACYYYSYNSWPGAPILKVRYPSVFNGRYYGTADMSPIDTFLLESFDWHPFIYLADVQPSGNAAAGDHANYATGYVIGDYCNYTVLDEVTLKKLHDACLLSLWGVPLVI